MWFKVDDKLHDHPKVRKADDVAAMGLWVMAGSWCGGNSGDGFVPAAVLKRWSPSWRRLAAKLEAAGLWDPATVDGEVGWVFHDWDACNPRKDETATDVGRLRWRRKNALLKDRALRERIVARDGCCCRYCGVRVSFADKRGKTGGTYDHVDPDGDNSEANVVVACRRCNGRKRDRTPLEAGMVLLPEPDRSQVGVGSGVGSDSASLRETVRELDPGRVGVGSGAGSEPDRPVVLNGSNGHHEVGDWT